jgi:hypothetical protein
MGGDRATAGAVIAADVDGVATSSGELLDHGDRGAQSLGSGDLAD